MKITLVFEDWQKNGKSIYHTGKGIDITMGDFHSGSSFDGEIELNKQQEDELIDAIVRGYNPVFWVTK